MSIWEDDGATIDELERDHKFVECPVESLIGKINFKSCEVIYFKCEVCGLVKYIAMNYRGPFYYFDVISCAGYLMKSVVE